MKRPGDFDEPNDIKKMKLSNDSDFEHMIHQQRIR